MQVYRKRLPVPEQSTDDTADAEHPPIADVADVTAERDPGRAFHSVAACRIPVRSDCAAVATIPDRQVGARGRLGRDGASRGRATRTPREPRRRIRGRRDGCMKFSDG